MSLKMKLKNMFEENRGLAGEISKKIGLSNATSLSKFVNLPEREMDSFNNLLSLVKELFNNEKQIMSEYILTLDPNKKTARYCLEYTQINKMYDIHTVLIEKMKNCKNTESKEWAAIYDIDYKYSFKVTNASDTVTDIIICNPEKLEMKAYAALLKAYCYYEMKCLSLMDESVRLCRILIPQIKDEYVRNSYISRLSLLASVSNFNSGNIEASRSYGEFGLTSNNVSINRWIYLSLGNSYLFESYEKSMEYLKKSLEVSVENGFKDSEEEAKKSINFLNILSNKQPAYEIKDNISRVHQEAFWASKNGMMEVAEMKLTSMDKSKMNKMQLAFHNYYLGKVLNSKTNILTSIRLFKQCGSLFYLQLPVIELQKMGECPEMIETLIA
jgi:tetratricopeptide (TPR) repeat protein